MTSRPVEAQQRETGNRKGCCGHNAPSQSPGLRFPFEFLIASSCHLPPEAATCHLRMHTPRAARGAAPTHIRYWRLAVGGWERRGMGFRSPFQPSHPPSVICHRFSHLPRPYPLHLIHSALRSVLNAVLHTVLNALPPSPSPRAPRHDTRRRRRRGRRPRLSISSRGSSRR